MAYNDEVRRIVLKRGAGVPTIPASADHRNGDWISTDIYEGEFYQDTDTGKVYTRQGSTIVNADGSAVSKKYDAKINQASTNAPTESNVIQDDLSGVWSYNSAGRYVYTATGLFPDATKVKFNIQNNETILTYSRLVVSAPNSVSLYVYDGSGTLVDDALVNADITIEVFE